MTHDVHALAAEGAAVLDEKVPGWKSKVDLERLNMDNGVSTYSTQCVLTQIFGDWEQGLKDLFGYDETATITRRLNISDRHGFGQDVMFPGLTEAWRSLIEKRRGLSPKPVELSAAEFQAFIDDWSDQLEKMYVNRTAGDYSFTGYVVALMRDASAKGVQLS